MPKVAVITGSRAEYGLLYCLMQELNSDDRIDFQLIVTGSHLSKELGETVDFIKQDGFQINYEVDMEIISDDPTSINLYMAKALKGLGQAYEELKPDLIVLLGDRYEIFMAAAAATIFRVPIAHIHGGERTEGAFDEAFRHSLTKMSHLHFTALSEYSNRVIQMGEDPKNVFEVGAIGLDNIKRLDLLSREELEDNLNFRFSNRNILVTFHPVTLEDSTSENQFNNLLEALDDHQDVSVIFTKSNADIDARKIDKLIDKYVSENNTKAISFNSMGQLLYLSTMQYVDAVVGNSSSGIIEAPSFKVGTINIGDRQKGRVKADSVINCLPTKESISEALNKNFSESFQLNLQKTVNPYGDGESAKKIKKILIDTLSKNTISLKKEFYDLKF